MYSVIKTLSTGSAGFCLVLTICTIMMFAVSCDNDIQPNTDVSPTSVSLVLVTGLSDRIGEVDAADTVWITSENQWSDLIASIPAGLMEIPPQPVILPDVDFEKYGVLLIRMGTKPNGGYGLALSADEAIIENREARIPVRWSEPEPEFLYTQAIVYPYLVIRMEKGPFDTIVVVDQNGQVKLRLSI